MEKSFDEITVVVKCIIREFCKVRTFFIIRKTYQKGTQKNYISCSAGNLTNIYESDTKNTRTQNIIFAKHIKYCLSDKY